MPEARVKTRKAAKRAASKSAAPPPKPRPRWWIYAAAAALTFFVAFLVYDPALNGPFVFDDMALPYHLPTYLTDLLAWVSGVRPLLMFTYWLNYLWSKDPYGFHLVNVLIHVINTFLVFAIVRKLSEPRPTEPRPSGSGPLLPAFAAAVFLLHPIQTESVSYIAGRSEDLSVMFFFAAFAAFLYRRSVAVSWKNAIAVLALFAAALASKEHTLVLAGLLLLTDYYWNPGFSLRGIRENWRIYVPMAACGLGGVGVVVHILSRAPSAGFALKDITWYQYFFTECRAFFVYLRLLVFPVGQNPDYDFAISRTILDHGAIFGLAAIVLLLAAAIYFRRRYPLASYGFLIFVLLLAPVSSFIPIKDPIAERRLYLPFIGMLLVAVAALERVRLDRRLLAAIMSAVVVVLAVATYQRNQLWANDLALWEDTARKSPNKYRVRFQLAHTEYAAGRCQEAVAEYSAAARLQPPDYGLLVDWGLAYECAGQPEVAIAKLKQAAALDPTAHVYTQISMVYAHQKLWPQALEALGQAEKLDPKYDMLYDNRGGVRANTNDLAGAVADYKHALALNPSNDHARQMLAIVEQQQARMRH